MLTEPDEIYHHEQLLTQRSEDRQNSENNRPTGLLKSSSFNVKSGKKKTLTF